MKIGYFVGKFPYSSPVPNYRYGGGEIVAYNLAVNMAKRGHTIHVFTTSAESKDSLEKEDLIIHRYGTIFRFLERNFSPNLIFKPLMYEVDVAHVHIASSPLELIAALIYMRTKKKPLVATYHGDVIPLLKGFTYKISVHIYNEIVKETLSRVNVIVSPSKYYINESIFLRKYSDKIVAIPNGVNVEDFDISCSKEECRKKLGLPLDVCVILFLGILHPKKGPEVLLKSIPHVTKEHKDVLFLFVGGGDVDKYRDLAKAMGLEEYVKFTGYVEEKLKPIYYKASDVFVLPSIATFEVFPLVLLEASAAGLPMIVSDLKTFRCIIEEGYNGLFTKVADEKGLANAIIYLLENEDLRRKMGKNAKERAKNYSWEKVAEKYEEVYRKLVE